MSKQADQLHADKLEKSKELAHKIEMIKLILINPMQPFDIKHAENAVIELRSIASAQDSAAALSRRYNPAKSKLIYQQAETMHHLNEFIKGLQKCQEMKDQIAKNEKFMDDISAHLGL